MSKNRWTHTQIKDALNTEETRILTTYKPDARADKYFILLTACVYNTLAGDGATAQDVTSLGQTILYDGLYTPSQECPYSLDQITRSCSWLLV